MRLTIVPSDKVVILDGQAKFDLDLSFCPPEVHAVQWYDTFGYVEFKDNPETLEKDPNQRIEELGIYEQAVTAWNGA